MTKAERKKLARAARELAMECVAGTAPKFGTGREFIDGRPCCAMGHAAARAGMTHEAFRVGSPICDAVGVDQFWIVATANDNQRDALPWALLSMADGLESSR